MADISIKLKISSIGVSNQTFTIKTNDDITIASNVTRQQLLDGIDVTFDHTKTSLKAISDQCNNTLSVNLPSITLVPFLSTPLGFRTASDACNAFNASTAITRWHTKQSGAVSPFTLAFNDRVFDDPWGTIPTIISTQDFNGTFNSEYNSNFGLENGQSVSLGNSRFDSIRDIYATAGLSSC